MSTATASAQDVTKVITGEVILSFPHLFTPKVNESGKAKYSAALLLPEGTDMSPYVAAANAAGLAKFGAKYESLRKMEGFKSGFRRDGLARGYPVEVYINTTSDNPVGVVDRYLDPKTEKPRKITDPAEMYPGCKVKASIRAFGYDNNGNKGISWALNNVQKWAEGDRLDGRKKAEDEFDADLAAPVASLDDLMK
jgi:hypothetical protein